MCRLYGFRATEPTKVECTLVLAQNALLSQSRADLQGVSHPDGWGISFYENGAPTVERRETAAFHDLHFSVTAERVFTTTVVAHVRRATVGGSSAANTHPFVHGCWTFAHNGTVRSFEQVGPTLEREISADLIARRGGSTDSELAFLWLLSRMRRQGIDIDRPATKLAPLVGLVGDSVRKLDDRCQRAGATKPAQLNFLLTDGRKMVVTRWRHSLHWVARQDIHDCEICGIPHVHHERGRAYRATVVASEPISHEAWQEVPDRSVLSVDDDLHTAITRF